MAVITISRGSFSGGKLIAECLAERLGYRCIDRDVIVERAAAYGVSQDAVQDAISKPPTFWDRFKHTKYIYLTLIQAALAEEVQRGKAVYHGNAGHLLLRGVSHVVRVRIIAPMAFRVAMFEDRLKLDRSEAPAYLEKYDHDRRKWTQYLYGVEWNDASLYDIVVNLEVLDIKSGCDIIAATARQACFEETPQSQKAMDDLVLASRVRANLVMSPGTAGLEVDVVAHDGVVRVKGKLSPGGQLADLEAAVRRVPGVRDLEVDLFNETGV
jgi:cytidylate kinase